MKVIYILIGQVVLLVGVIILGLMLKGDLLEGPRILHRIAGSLAGIVGLIGAVMLLRQPVGLAQKVLACLAVTFIFIAGLAGSSLKIASNYLLTFNLMEISGSLALISSIALLVLVLRSKPATKTLDETVL